MPVVNIPAFAGAHGMPVGLSIVARRGLDRHLVAFCKTLSELFRFEGGWRTEGNGDPLFSIEATTLRLGVPDMTPESTSHHTK